MVKAFFRRALKIENGIVVDHRPVEHDEPGTWLVVDVPMDLPASLNALIYVGTITSDGETVTWPTEYTPPIRRPHISADAVLLRAVSKRLDISAAELITAKAELESEHDGE